MKYVDDSWDYKVYFVGKLVILASKR